MQGEKKLLYAALVLGSFNFLSLILGMIRDRLFASQIGPGEILDTYYAAFRIPDTINLIIMSVISAVTIIPIFSKLIDSGEYKKLGEMFSTLIIFVAAILAFFAAIMYFLIPHTLDWYVPGFSMDQKAMLVDMTRVLMLQPIFLATSYVVGAILQTKERFFYFSLAPVLYNFGGILGVAVFYPMYGASGLGLGIVCGAILHLLSNLAGLSRIPDKLWDGFSFSLSHIREIASVAGPRSLTLGVQQLRLLTFATAGSLLPAGAISVYNLSYNLYWIPVSIIVMSYLVTVYPKLTSLKSQAELDNFVSNILNYFIFIIIPIAVFGFIFRAHLVRIIYGTGVFDWQSTKLIAATFAIFLFALVFDAIRKLFSRVLFARGVVYVQLAIEVMLLFVQSFIFLFAFKNIVNAISPHLAKILNISTDSVPTVSLAVVFFLLCLVEVIILYFFVRKHVNLKLNETLWHSVVSSLFGGILAYLGLNIFEDWNKINETTIGLLLQMSLAAMIGLFVWYITLKIFNNRDILTLEQAIKLKIWKKERTQISESLESVE